MREVRRLEDRDEAVPVAALAASFQAAVVDVLVGKTLAAAKDHKAKSILVAGGVSANEALREAFKEQARKPVYIPPIELCTDNAAMIACAGYYHFIRGEQDALDIDALPSWQVAS